jgi:hypothetical protein
MELAAPEPPVPAAAALDVSLESELALSTELVAEPAPPVPGAGGQGSALVEPMVEPEPPVALVSLEPVSEGLMGAELPVAPPVALVAPETEPELPLALVSPELGAVPPVALVAPDWEAEPPVPGLLGSMLLSGGAFVVGSAVVPGAWAGSALEPPVPGGGVVVAGGVCCVSVGGVLLAPSSDLLWAQPALNRETAAHRPMNRFMVLSNRVSGLPVQSPTSRKVWGCSPGCNAGLPCPPALLTGDARLLARRSPRRQGTVKPLEAWGSERGPRSDTSSALVTFTGCRAKGMRLRPCHSPRSREGTKVRSCRMR